MHVRCRCVRGSLLPSATRLGQQHRSVWSGLAVFCGHIKTGGGFWFLGLITVIFSLVVSLDVGMGASLCSDRHKGCDAAQLLCCGWQLEAIGQGASQHRRRQQQLVPMVQISKAVHVAHPGLSVYEFVSKLVLVCQQACAVAFA
jgi:hypothetical protein